MKYVGSFARLIALSIVSLSLISCQKMDGVRNLRATDLPQASSYNVAITSDFPGVVSVSLPSGGLCTGTIISPKAVLTAAHCTQGSGQYSVKGSFGTVRTSVVENFGPGEVEDPNDISILVFPANTFPQNSIINIADSARIGETARLVGFGCNNIDTRTGAGVKRTGTNVIADVYDYVEFYTPATSSNSRGIIGPQNRAGSCFGDSGGPALKEVSGELRLIAVTHAGGQVGNTIVSQYTDVANRSDNRGFIARVNQDYNLGVNGF